MTFKYQQEEVNESDSRGVFPLSFCFFLVFAYRLELAKKIYEKLGEKDNKT
jgi:hypothetical protein